MGTDKSYGHPSFSGPLEAFEAFWGLGLGPSEALGPWSRVPTKGPLARAAPWPEGPETSGPWPVKALGTGGPLARRPLGGPSPSVGDLVGALGPETLDRGTRR